MPLIDASTFTASISSSRNLASTAAIGNGAILEDSGALVVGSIVVSI